MKQKTLLEWENHNYKIVSLYKQGEYNLAITVAYKALQIIEDEGGIDHPKVALSLNNLALLHKSQGQYQEAEKLYKISLTFGELALGPDHPSLATSMNNLVVLYSIQGRYEEAESFYRRALEIKLKV